MVRRFVLLISGVGFLSGLLLFVGVWRSVPSRSEFHRMKATVPAQSGFWSRDGVLLDARPRAFEVPDSLMDYYSHSYISGPWVPYDSLPPYLPRYLKSVEGWSPYGFDISSLVRAIVRKKGGGSTVTMQVYRLLTEDNKPNYRRKLSGIVASTKLSLVFTEEGLIEIYLNLAPFAEMRAGIGYAARDWFNTSVSALTKGQAVKLLARLPNPTLSETEIDSVYQVKRKLLHDKGELSEAEFEALKVPPPFQPASFSGYSPHALFVDTAADVARSLLKGTGWTLGDGVRVVTTLGADLNALAARQLEAYDGPGTPSLLLLDEENRIQIYTVGMSHPGDLDLLQSDRALPSSRMKMVVYALYAETLRSQDVNPQEILQVKLPTRYEGEAIIVDDEENRSYVTKDEVTLRYAIVHSLNAPAYHVVNNVFTPKQIKRFAGQLGLDVEAYPSLGLGTTEVSEFDLVTAFSVLNQHGALIPPLFIDKIYAPTGGLIYNGEEARQGALTKTPVISEPVTDLMKQLLREVADEGTARTPNSCLGFYDTGAKTGTSSDDSRHRYFGFTGFIGRNTLSILLQGKGFPSYAWSGNTVVPLASDVLCEIKDKL